MVYQPDQMLQSQVVQDLHRGLPAPADVRGHQRQLGLRPEGPPGLQVPAGQHRHPGDELLGRGLRAGRGAGAGQVSLGLRLFPPDLT